METTNKLNYLTFRLGTETLALSTTKVLEVIQNQKIQRVPNAPEFVKGVINFRGDIVTVYDSRQKFGLESDTETDEFVVVVIDEEIAGVREIIGAVVDSVKDVIAIAETDIKPVPQMKSNFDPEFLEGLVLWEGLFILLLNTTKTFYNEFVEVR